MTALLLRLGRLNLQTMRMQTDVPATFTLSGDYEHRVLEVLKVAKHQERLAQGGTAPRMQDALVGLEDAFGVTTRFVRNRTLSRETRLITPLQ
jgi:hypothetical protein